MASLNALKKLRESLLDEICEIEDCVESLYETYDGDEDNEDFQDELNDLYGQLSFVENQLEDVDIQIGEHDGT